MHAWRLERAWPCRWSFDARESAVAYEELELAFDDLLWQAEAVAPTPGPVPAPQPKEPGDGRPSRASVRQFPWKLHRARIVKHVSGPFNALGCDVAMEEVTLAYERLEME